MTWVWKTDENKEIASPPPPFEGRVWYADISEDPFRIILYRKQRLLFSNKLSERFASTSSSPPTAHGMLTLFFFRIKRRFSYNVWKTTTRIYYSAQKSITIGEFFVCVFVKEKENSQSSNGPGGGAGEVGKKTITAFVRETPCTQCARIFICVIFK